MNITAKQKLDLILGGALLLLVRLPVSVLGKLLKRDHTPAPRGPILVIKMLGGGSLVIAYPALLGIRKQYKDRRLILLTSENVKPFAESLSLFDEIICIRDESIVSLITSSITAWLRCFCKIDTVVDLEVYSRLSTVFSVLTAARNRIGFYLENTYWRRKVYSHLFFFNRFSGSYFFYDAIAQLLGADIPSRKECENHFRSIITPADKAKGKRRISIGHSCSDFGTERMLTPGQWVQVVKWRNPREEELVFLGSKADYAEADKIIDCVKKPFPGLVCMNLCGVLPLRESVAYIDSSDEFWGIDSALLHYALLLGKKTVSFWGPTDPQTRIRPDGLGSDVYYRKIPCSPCIHVAEAPPCSGRNICIEAIFNDLISAESALQSILMPMSSHRNNS